MKELILQIIKNTQWLYIKIYESKIFFIDFWSFAHLSSGMLIYLLLLYFNVKNKWKILFLILFFYEVIEITLKYYALNIFLPETIKDQFTDVLIGMLGGYFVNIIFSFIETKDQLFIKKFLGNAVAISISIQLAFWWVGSYNYYYNIELFNSYGINYTSFICWSCTLIFMIRVYFILKKHINNQIISIIFYYLTYLVMLFVFEFITFHILGIKEISSKEKTAFVFNIIHGTALLHFVYLTIPLIGLAFFFAILKLTEKAFVNYCLIKQKKFAFFPIKTLQNFFLR